MEKPFNQWNDMKQKIEKKDAGTEKFFYEREIWWCAVGINIGIESDGKNEHFERPVLIIRKFNGHMLWGIPLTSKQHNGVHFFRIRHNRSVSFACLSQLKTISSKRLLRKIGMITLDEFRQIQDKIIGYIQKSDPATSRVLGGRSH